MDSKVIKHFKKADPILYEFIALIEPIAPFSQKNSDLYFEELCDSIVSQQLSGKAAATIFNRFKELFPKEKVTPKAVLKLSDEKLRSVGLSGAKTKYIKDLAQKVESGELDLSKLTSLSDDEIIEELIKVKGIGRWTVEMFLIFTLGREDVFSIGDLGLRNGLKKVYGEKTADEIEEIIKKWAPFRSYASRILWRVLDLKD